MPDLTTAGAAEEPRLADGERREVVVEVEPLVGLVEQLVHALHVAPGAERHLREDLRLAAREERRAVDAREVVDLRPDLADLVEGAAVDAAAFAEDHLAHDFALDGRERVFDVAFRGLALEADRFERVVHDAALHFGDDFVADVLEPAVEALLVVGLAEVRGDPLGRDAPDLIDELVVGDFEVVLHRLDGAFRGLDLLTEFDLAAAELLDRLVGEVERGEHVVLAHLLHLALDHHDGVFLAGDDQVEVAFGRLVNRRVDEELAVDAADAHVRRRAVEGRAGEVERRRAAEAAENVGVDLLIGRHDAEEHLDFVAEAVGEERTDRAVDEAGGERLLVGGTALALHEAAGEFAGGAELLAVVDGKREEVLAFARAVVDDGGAEHHRVALADDDGAVRPAWRSCPFRARSACPGRCRWFG